MKISTISKTWNFNKLPNCQAFRTASEVSLLGGSIFRTCFFVVSLPSTRQLNNVDWALLGAASCCCGRWKIAGSLEYRQSLFATQTLQGLCFLSQTTEVGCVTASSSNRTSSLAWIYKSFRWLPFMTWSILALCFEMSSQLQS